MATFHYKTASMDGTITRGHIEAADEASAANSLRLSDAILLELKSGQASIINGKNLFAFAGGAKYDLLTFTTELSSLLNAGLPLDRALDVLAGISESRGMRQTVESVLKNVKEGSSFSDALQKHPDVFPKLYVNMIRAGEAGGVLDIVLENLNQFLEARKELKDYISSAMIYPVILIAFSGLSVLFLVTYVLPKFSSIFQDMGATLPVSTRLLLSASDSIRAWWWVFPVPVLLLLVFYRFYSATKGGRYSLDRLKIRLLGGVIVKIETARFCRTLGTLLTSGVPLLPALKNSKEVMTNEVMASVLEEVSKNVSEGKGIAQSLSNTKVFPQLAISMIKVGEETGQLAEMLLRVATIYEKFLKSAIKKLTAFLEPALILCMGLTVGFIVVSMLSAIFSITDFSF
ncbi:MAG: type II secretion system F family protein [Nitrospiraceae bacterium]|nr:type II secretion system F family protein [Nitrospiraceae bacterium]